MNKKRFSTIFLMLGLLFLTIGISTDNTIYTWISIIFVLLSLIFGGRWMRPRR
ncbi:MAG: hypothetical protein JNK81_15375 [Anaerolineales bacterium]|nr:hypothetical protein [Anaerolineales bacterium]